MDIEGHRYRRLNWLYSLAGLADIEAQRREWLDKTSTNPGWSYVEYVCRYFDDTGVSHPGYAWLVADGQLLQREIDAVRPFHEALDLYVEPNGVHDPAAILSDPEWQRIVSLGEHCLAELYLILTDDTERKAIANAISSLRATE